MGNTRSKDVVYSYEVPETQEVQYSNVLRHPDANEIIVLPTVWGESNYYSLFQ